MVHGAAAVDRQSFRLTTMPTVPDWSATTGDVWAERWQDLDRALAGVTPHLVSAVLDLAPPGPFRAFDVGCGAAATTVAVANERSDAAISACDLSPSLARIAEERTRGLKSVQVLLGDAEALAVSEGPFELFFSRHGVMFFPNPVRAFSSLHDAATPGGSLVFSCFHDWSENAWASEVASATAGREIPSPGREPSGFAFSDPDYVRDIFGASGWSDWEGRVVALDYLAGEGAGAIDQAVSLLTEIGPASALLKAMDESDREPALKRLRKVVESYFESDAVRFPASIWIWSAKIGSA